jgi:NADH:ubiquinone oxidoreductase subunit 5 (subunit L)/multisubunit Na+/H+ antiporter MnhA subunit
MFNIKTSYIGQLGYNMLNKRWLFDKVFNDFMVRPSLVFGYEVSFKTLDKGAIEILGPYGIAGTFRKLAMQLSQIQSGFVYHYAFIMLIGLTIFIAIIGLWDWISFWVDNRLYFIFLLSLLFLNQDDLNPNMGA